MTGSMWTTFWVPLGFLPLVDATCKLNTCTILFISTASLLDTYSATSLRLEHGSPWLVSLQRLICNWDSETSHYRGLETMIWLRQVPACTSPLGVQAKYGIVGEVAKPVNKVRVWYLKS